MILTPEQLRAAFKKLGVGGDDFQLAAEVGAGFVARTRAGGIAWVVPLSEAAETSGRRAGGFVLAPMSEVAFEFEGRRWSAPAAVWESTDSALLDTFLVLIADAARSLEARPSWKQIVEYVDQWQSLLARRPTLTPEQQLGLWAELSIIERSESPDVLVAGWRGPEGDPVDFFVDEVGLEIKASRRRHAHHVSQSQANRPVGQRESFTLSLWVGSDPTAGTSVVDLVEKIVERVVEKPEFLRKLSKVGFSIADQESYRSTRFVELEPFVIFRTDDIPRVHDVDPAISELRYLVTLNAEDGVGGPEAARVRAHFELEEPKQGELK
jgi:hypothetical protein